MYGRGAVSPMFYEKSVVILTKIQSAKLLILYDKVDEKIP